MPLYLENICLKPKYVDKTSSSEIYFIKTELLPFYVSNMLARYSYCHGNGQWGPFENQYRLI